MKTYLIAANWKQNGTSKTLCNLTKNIISLAKKRKIRHKIVLFPPTVYLSNIFPLIRKTKNIEQLTLAPLLGEAIKRISKEKSVSSLFD